MHFPKLPMCVPFHSVRCATALLLLSTACQAREDVGDLVDARLVDSATDTTAPLDADLDRGFVDAREDRGTVTADTGPNVDAAPTIDSGPDASPDAGVCNCRASSCFDYACGRSPCGFHCGDCAAGQYCMNGSCRTGTAPGTPCIDATGARIEDGEWGFIRWPTTCGTGHRRVQCLGGDWRLDDAVTCVDLRCATRPGGPCTAADQCGPGGCNPNFGRCGEVCNVGPNTCAAGTACFVPGDISGLCLELCSNACGSGWNTVGYACTATHYQGPPPTVYVAAPVGLRHPCI